VGKRVTLSRQIPDRVVELDLHVACLVDRISGYLINGILLRRCKAGSFTYADFYSKRIRRIFPALLPVLVVTSLCGWVYYSQRHFEWIGGSMFAGCGFSANIFFQVVGENPDSSGPTRGYMEATDSSGPTNPLLHLWSLGVEEQFYIGWPVIAPAILRHKNVWTQGAMYAILFAASMAINLWLGFTGSGSAAYYLVASRFWEILIGCCLSHVENEMDISADALPPNVAELISAVGSTMVVVSLVMTTKTMVFPGWVALFPTCGTALVLFAGKGAWLNRWLYGNKLFAYIGRISYPMYLWHWPLFAYGKFISESHRSMANPAPLLAQQNGWCPCEKLECFPTGTRLGLIVSTVLLSMGTLQFVEKPLRNHRSEWTPWFLSAGGVGLFVFGLAVFLGAINSFPALEYANSEQSQVGPEYHAPAVSASLRPFNMLDDCLRHVTAASLKAPDGFGSYLQPGRVINPGREDVVLVWGDSHAAHLLPRIEYLASDPTIASVMPSVKCMVVPSVPPLPASMGKIEYWYLLLRMHCDKIIRWSSSLVFCEN
jgi:peptidoglycan/LPS O-acetylase OafA/YrhL